MIRGSLCGFPEPQNCLSRLAVPPVHYTKVGQDIGVTRLQGKGLFVGLDGFRVIVAVKVSVTQLDQCPNVVGIFVQYPFELGNFQGVILHGRLRGSRRELALRNYRNISGAAGEHFRPQYAHHEPHHNSGNCDNHGFLAVHKSPPQDSKVINTVCSI